MKRCSLLVLFAAQTAHAQPARLKEEFQAGVDAYRLGKYDEARTRLEKARELDPKLPGPHRFLAAVSRAQGRWDDCIRSARTAMELNPASSEIADTRSIHDECRASAGRAPYRGELGESAAIAVTTNVPGAIVKINGLTYGGTPLIPRPITAGTLDVEIQKSGWKPARTTVNALAGIVTDVAIDLEPDPAAQGGGDSLVTGPELPRRGYLAIPNQRGTLRIDGKPTEWQPRIELEAGTHTVEIVVPGHDPWLRRVQITRAQTRSIEVALVDTARRESRERRGLYLIGGGGVLIVAGAVTALLSNRAADEARDIVRVERARDPSRPLEETAVDDPVRTRADLADARDRASRWSLVSNVAYGVGIVTVGAGLYYLWRGVRERPDATPPFAIAPLHGGALLAKEIAW